MDLSQRQYAEQRAMNAMQVAPPAVKPEASPILARMGENEDGLRALASRLSDLEFRLSGVMQPMPPTVSGAGQDKAPTPNPTDLMSRLTEEHRLLCIAHDIIGRINERLLL